MFRPSTCLSPPGSRYTDMKKKRYYIDRTENKLIFITSGNRNRMVRSPEMNTIRILEHKEDSTIYEFPEVYFQEEHSLSDYNAKFLEQADHNLIECGIDTKYMFFWRRCVKSHNPHYHSYDSLFRTLKNQKN